MIYGQQQCLFRVQPVHAEACINDTAAFTARVDTLFFEDSLYVEWLHKPAGGSWTIVPSVFPFSIVNSGVNSDLTLIVGNEGIYDNYLFKCRISGIYESDQASLNINDLPQVSFSMQDFCYREITRFTNTSVDQSEMVSWKWELSDNTTYFAKEINHMFPGPGEYTVTLSGTNDQGCTGSSTSLVTINSLPEPEILFTKDIFCSYESNASFYTMGSYDSYLWTIEGKSGTFQSDGSEIIFNCDENFPTGQYKVTLTVSRPEGCYGSTEKNFLVLSSKSPVDGYVVQKENDSKLLVLLIDNQDLSTFRWLKIDQVTKDTIVDEQTAYPYNLFEDAIDTQNYKYGVEVIPAYSDCSALFFLKP
jgi:PKD repeat protein